MCVAVAQRTQTCACSARWRKPNSSCTPNALHVHPRSTKIKARTGKDNDAQSKIRTARSRFIARRVTLVASALLLQRRTLDHRQSHEDWSYGVICRSSSDSHRLYPASQLVNRHEIDDPFGWNLCPQNSGQAELNKFQLPRMMSIGTE